MLPPERRKARSMRSGEEYPDPRLRDVSCGATVDIVQSHTYNRRIHLLARARGRG